MKGTLQAVAAVVAMLVVSGSARADPDGCGPILDAIGKMNAAPRIQQRGLVTGDGTSQPYSTDLLGFEDQEYSRQREGAWHAGPRMQVPLVIDGKAAIFDCRRAGADTSGGVAMTIYTYKRLMPKPRIVRDVRLWVADGTGLPERSQIETGSGAGRRRAEFTFRYDPDAAPPVAGDP
jgi:hypothetical protein